MDVKGFFKGSEGKKRLALFITAVILSAVLAAGVAVDLVLYGTEAKRFRYALGKLTDKDIIGFYCEDYNNDGDKEAIAFAGNGSESGFYNAQMWYITNKTETCVYENLSGKINGILKKGEYKFLSVEMKNGGSEVSYIYSAESSKTVFQPEISGKLKNVHMNDGKIVSEDGTEVFIPAPVKLNTDSGLKKDQKTGDIIRFGSYPQKLVDDKVTLKYLEKADKKWKKLDCAGCVGMEYSDFELYEKNYRAIRFSEYRQASISDLSETSFQEANGYCKEDEYYFEYEPLNWRVLDAKSGLVCTDMIINAQPYFDYASKSGEYDFTASSIKEWLNTDFYNTAFSGIQQTKIKPASNNIFIKNSSGALIADKVFLLSADDIHNADYGFAANDGIKLKATDYAQCMGLKCADGQWMLDSDGNEKSLTLADASQGSVFDTYYGVVPAIRLK